MKFAITYKMDGLTEYVSFGGVVKTFATKSEAQNFLATKKRDYPEIKGWRIVRI